MSTKYLIVHVCTGQCSVDDLDGFYSTLEKAVDECEENWESEECMVLGVSEIYDLKAEVSVTAHLRAQESH